MEEDSKITAEIRNYLSNNDYSGLKEFYTNNNEIQEEILSDFWNITTMLTQYINLEQFTWSQKSVNCAANLVEFISHRAPARELYLALTETLDAFKDDCKLLLLLPSYANCLCRMTSRDLQWACPEAFHIVIAHLKGLPTPSNCWSMEMLNMQDATAYTNFLMNDFITERYIQVSCGIMDFIHKVNSSTKLKLKMENKKEDATHGDNNADNNGLLLKCYLDMLIYGLLPLRFWRIMNATGGSNIKDVVNEIILKLSQSIHCIYTILYDNKYNLNNEQLIMCYYLITIVKPSCLSIPQVITPIYLLNSILPYVQLVLQHDYETDNRNEDDNDTDHTVNTYVNKQPKVNSPSIMELCILIIKQLLSSIETNSLVSEIWHNNLWKSIFCENLLTICTYDNISIVRQLAAQSIQAIFIAANDLSKYQLFHIWLRNSKQSNQISFFISLLKTSVAQAICQMESVTGKDESIIITMSQTTTSPFLGNKLMKLFYLIFLLPNGVASDLVDIHDWILANLNFLYFMLIRDKENNFTGIWSNLSWFQENYLFPLREAINISRAHYQKEINDLTKENTSSLSCFDISLPNISPQEHLDSIKKCLISLDLLNFKLSQVTDVVDTHNNQMKR